MDRTAVKKLHSHSPKGEPEAAFSAGTGDSEYGNIEQTGRMRRGSWRSLESLGVASEDGSRITLPRPPRTPLDLARDVERARFRRSSELSPALSGSLAPSSQLEDYDDETGYGMFIAVAAIAAGLILLALYAV